MKNVIYLQIDLLSKKEQIGKGNAKTSFLNYTCSEMPAS